MQHYHRSSNSHFPYELLHVLHAYNRVDENFAMIFVCFFFCCKKQTGSKPKYFMAIFSDHAPNSKYIHNKPYHLGCLLLSGAPQATKSVSFCGLLNISLFILSGTASGKEIENSFHARMTNRPVMHSRLY